MHYRFQSGEQVYEVTIERRGETLQAAVDGQPFAVEVLDAQPGQLSLRVDGKPLTLYWADNGSGKWFSLNGCTYRLEKPSPRKARAHDGREAGGESIRAPMPAQVRAVQVEPGESVEKGATLLLLEAMKMEIRIKTPIAGRVKRLLVSDGQAVEKEQVLAEVEPEVEA